MSRPLVDLNTVIAIESLFHAGPRDPWAEPLAGEFADLFVYGDTVRYPLPLIGKGSGKDDPTVVPSLIRDLSRRDSSALCPHEFSTEDKRFLDDQYLGECFKLLEFWANANPNRLRDWTAFHNAQWVRDLYRAQFAHQYMFSVEKLEKSEALGQLSRRRGVSASDLLYTLDGVLRLPLYGEFAGEKEHYLNHPLRDAFQLPTAREESGIPPHVTVPFNDSVSQFVLESKPTQDEYTILLHELRGQVRGRGLHKLGPGQVEPEVIRDVKAKVGLPPDPTDISKGAAIVGGVLSGVGGIISSLAPITAVAGAAISISTELWKGPLSRAVSRVRWVRWRRWPFRRDVEDQCEKRG